MKGSLLSVSLLGWGAGMVLGSSSYLSWNYGISRMPGVGIRASILTGVMQDGLLQNVFCFPIAAGH
ncbi:hypothetical protein BDW59DRAFT_148024 [Aspergillus cavernicola]|uniref:Major facilitator superfamily (MFS) profile domain-containing protein n=1 Tax=Aspergillus cavernicola TaxID=176166 RepID=A0ABR4I8L1_9EURO